MSQKCFLALNDNCTNLLFSKKIDKSMFFYSQSHEHYSFLSMYGTLKLQSVDFNQYFWIKYVQDVDTV